MSATGRGTERAASDYYPTPRGATYSLFRELGPITGPVLEPCAGDGAIIRAAVENRHTDPQQWTAWDVRSYQGSLSTDFLALPAPASPVYEWCVTNPPYSLAREFVDQARRFARNVWMLLRINFLGSRKRRDWWAQNPLTHLWVLSQRPSFTGHGTDACEYAWFGWYGREFVPTSVDLRVL